MSVFLFGVFVGFVACPLVLIGAIKYHDWREHKAKIKAGFYDN